MKGEQNIRILDSEGESSDNQSVPSLCSRSHGIDIDIRVWHFCTQLSRVDFS